MGKINLFQKIKTYLSPKQRFWIRLALPIGLIITLYYGYCWGIWGRSSLLMQFIFQCGCPLSSNEFRYPEYIDVIVPACQRNSAIPSPSGRFLYVNNYLLWKKFGYFLNLETGEKDTFSIPERYTYFLNDDLLYISLSYSDGEYILDRITKIRYPITRFRDFNPDASIKGEVNLEILAQNLKENKQVYLIDNDIVVAIDLNFRDSPSSSFYTGSFDIPRDEIENFLITNNIPFIDILDYPLYHPSEIISFDKKFIARDDGIYLSETDQKIIDGFSPTEEYRPASNKFFWVIGWAYNGIGAIYAKKEEVCLIEMNIFVSDVCIFRVPQPVLLLKVPQEYLDIPTQ